MKILAVCGMGLGSGLVLRMQAEKALKEIGIVADVEVSDIGTARALASSADLILTSVELAEQLGTVKPKVVTISLECLHAGRRFRARTTGSGGLIRPLLPDVVVLAGEEGFEPSIS